MQQVYSVEDRFVKPAEYARRGIAIYNQILNGLGLPNKFHEIAMGLFIAGNWKQTDEFQPIPLAKVADWLSVLNGDSIKVVYNRLKQNGPGFLEWLEETGILLFEVKRATRRKEPNQFRCPYFDHIEKILSSDLTTKKWRIREMTDTLCSQMEANRVVAQTRRRKATEPRKLLKCAAKKIFQAQQQGHPDNNIADDLVELLREEGASEDFIRSFIEKLKIDVQISVL